MSEKADKSYNASESKLDQAESKMLLVEDVLIPQLEQAKDDVDKLEEDNKDIAKRLDTINS